MFAIHNAYFSDISESQYILLAIIDFLFNQDGQLEKSNSKGKGPTPTNTKRQVLNYLLIFRKLNRYVHADFRSEGRIANRFLDPVLPVPNTYYSSFRNPKDILTPKITFLDDAYSVAEPSEEELKGWDEPDLPKCSTNFDNSMPRRMVKVARETLVKTTLAMIGTSVNNPSCSDSDSSSMDSMVSALTSITSSVAEKNPKSL